MKYNNIDKCSKHIDDCDELNLSEKRLKKLPNIIGDLKNLKELGLSDNGLISLPESIGDLKNLETLDLSGNDLEELPKSIGDLQNLKELNLKYNRLKSLCGLKGKQIKSLKEFYYDDEYLSNEEKKYIKKCINKNEIYCKKLDEYCDIINKND